MANTIKPKRSYTTTTIPSGLSSGELAVNAADGKMWIGSSDGKSNVLISSLSLSDMAGSTTNIAEGSNLYYTDSRSRLSLSAGTGITYNNTTGVITNSSPDQIVSLTAGTDIGISGTYPNFTIDYTGTGGTGTVTSVGITSTSSALTITNSPITTSGNIGVNFAGKGSEYVTGDGSLKSFPTTIAQSETLITEVYNETGATLTKGAVVFINGGHGNLPTITKAQANSDANSAQTYGVVENDISDQSNGYVVVIGSIIDLNTNSYSPGTQLYLSPTTAGAWTSTKPSAPNHLVYVAIVVRQHSTQGVVEVKIQNGYELDEIHDVSITSVAPNNILRYNSTSKVWENVDGTTSSISEGSNLYYTDARARASVSSSAIGLTYTSGTGAFSLTAGYSIPTTSSQTNWDTAYTNRITSLTTTGSSGAATLSSNTLNIPTYTLAGLGGQASSTNLTSLSGLTYASPSFVKMTASGTFSLDTGTYITSGGALGTPSSGTLTNCTFPTLNQNTTGSAASCTGNSATATSLTGGSGGTIPYQSAAGTTAMLAAGTSGQLLQSNGTAAPSWVSTLTGVTITGTKETKVAVSASAIDLATGNYFTKTISGAITFTISNTPATGTGISFIFDLTNAGSATITWWSGVKWAGGTAPTLTSSGRDTLGFFSHDGGTTWSGLVLGKDIK